MESMLERELERSFPKIFLYFSPEDLDRFRQMPVDALEEFQVGPGTLIRLHLLQPRNRLYKLFLQQGVETGEQMTMETLKAYHCHLFHELGEFIPPDPEA